MEKPIRCWAVASRDEGHIWFLLFHPLYVGCHVVTFLTPSQSLLCLWLPSWWPSPTHCKGQLFLWPSWFSPQPMFIKSGALSSQGHGFHAEKCLLQWSSWQSPEIKSEQGQKLLFWMSFRSISPVPHSSLWTQVSNVTVITLQNNHFPIWLWLSFLSPRLGYLFF